MNRWVDRAVVFLAWAIIVAAALVLVSSWGTYD